MFPLSIEGAVDIPPDGVGAALDRVKSAVTKAQPKSIERQGQILRFRGGMFRRVSNWNLLGPVDECVVDGNSEKLRYICSTRDLLIVTIFAALLIFVFVQVMARETISLQLRIAISLAAWGWLFGMNYLIASLRLRRVFVRAMQSSDYKNA